MEDPKMSEETLVLGWRRGEPCSGTTAKPIMHQTYRGYRIISQDHTSEPYLIAGWID